MIPIIYLLWKITIRSIVINLKISKFNWNIVSINLISNRLWTMFFRIINNFYRCMYLSRVYLQKSNYVDSLCVSWIMSIYVFGCTLLCMSVTDSNRFVLRYNVYVLCTHINVVDCWLLGGPSMYKTNACKLFWKSTLLLKAIKIYIPLSIMILRIFCTACITSDL